MESFPRGYWLLPFPSFLCHTDLDVSAMCVRRRRHIQHEAGHPENGKRLERAGNAPNTGRCVSGRAGVEDAAAARPPGAVDTRPQRCGRGILWRVHYQASGSWHRGRGSNDNNSNIIIVVVSSTTRPAAPVGADSPSPACVLVEFERKAFDNQLPLLARVALENLGRMHDPLQGHESH